MHQTAVPCKKCKVSKPLDDYPTASNTKIGKAGTCKECAANKWKKVRAERSRTLVDMHGNKCKDCGITHEKTGFFDFHHLDPSTKKYEVKTIICSSWKRVLEEADKCVMLCPNCHRLRHLED